MFAAAVNVTDPDPVRPVPFVKVSPASLLVALHAQPAWVVTVMLPVLPEEDALAVAGLIAYVQA